jgi:Na+/proline symporter
MWIILAMMLAFYAVVIYILYATLQTDNPDFDEYAVGGRRYGPIFIGMTYVQSWFPGAMFIAFFGISAGLGVLGFYCLAYSLLGLCMMYFMANRAWRWGQKYDLRSQPDLMAKRYDSEAVKKVASVIGIVSILPWVILGMQALGTIFRVATHDSWSLTVCLLAGLAVIIIRQYWTVRMGMRGLIMTDMLQGTVAYLVAGLVCIVILFGGKGSVAPYSNLMHVPVALLKVPGDGGHYGSLYMLSLVFMGTIGALAWPMSFQRIYTAKNVGAVKTGTVYAVGIAGFYYALLTLVAISAATVPAVIKDPQGGWFLVLDKFGGTWLLGLACVCVLGAGMGHVDGCVQVSGIQIANDLINRKSHPLSSHQLTVVAKTSMIVYMAVAGVLAYLLFNISRLQLLAQMSYYGIIQLSVPLLLGIFWRRGNKYGALAGMCTGFPLALALGWWRNDDIRGLGSLTAGMVGLGANLLVYLVVTALTGQSVEEKARVAQLFEETRVVSGTRGAPVAQPVPVLTAEALGEAPAKS